MGAGQSSGSRKVISNWGREGRRAAMNLPTKPSITVRTCESLEDFHACVALQREIWGEDDLEVEPATMFVVASHTGGQVLGAYDGNTLVGFTLALAALRHSP